MNKKELLKYVDELLDELEPQRKKKEFSCDLSAEGIISIWVTSWSV